MVDEHWERRPDGTAVRVLRDPALSGTAWRIWLADTRCVPGAHAEHCLIFDTGDRVRRVWSVPEDWGRMSADALIALADASSPGRGAPHCGAPHRETPRRATAESRASDAL